MRCVFWANFMHVYGGQVSVRQNDLQHADEVPAKNEQKFAETDDKENSKFERKVDKNNQKVVLFRFARNCAKTMNKA